MTDAELAATERAEAERRARAAADERAMEFGAAEAAAEEAAEEAQTELSDEERARLAAALSDWEDSAEVDP